MAVKQIQRIQDLVREDKMVQWIHDLNHELSQTPHDRLFNVVPEEFPHYRVVPNTPSAHRLINIVPTSSDAVGIGAVCMWVADGPKIARPTPEQAEAFSHISLDLSVNDFACPFRCLLVELSDNPVFKACLICTGFDGCLCLNLYSRHGKYDITTMIRADDKWPIENSLRTVEKDEDLERDLEHSHSAQRVALNMALALTNYGCDVGPAYPKALVQDQWLAKSPGEKGEKAARRVKEAFHQVKFTKEITVRKPTQGEPGDPTGRTVAPHWVRGHWKMQPHGPNGSLRKRILIRPYLVHAARANEINPAQVTVYTDKRG